MTTRSERITAAKAKLNCLDQQLQPLLDQQDKAKVELNRAEASFDIGEAVSVEETCRRGCCVERQFTGVVHAQEENHTWQVLQPDGTIRRYVSRFNMKRKAQ